MRTGRARARAESLWKYECPEFIFIRAPSPFPFMWGTRMLGSSSLMSFSQAKGRAFPSGNIPSFDVRSHFAPTNDITKIGVMRRIPTNISTSSFTTFDHIFQSTSRTSSCGWCTPLSKTRRWLSTFASEHVLTSRHSKFYDFRKSDSRSRLSNKHMICFATFFRSTFWLKCLLLYLAMSKCCHDTFSGTRYCIVYNLKCTNSLYVNFFE